MSAHLEAIRDKILKKNFSFTDEEKSAINNNLKSYYGPLYNLIYYTMVLEDSQYDSKFWDEYFTFWKSINSAHIRVIMHRILRYNGSNNIYRLHKQPVAKINSIKTYISFAKIMGNKKELDSLKKAIVSLLVYKGIDIPRFIEVIKAMSPTYWKDVDSFVRDVAKVSHKTIKGIIIFDKVAPYANKDYSEVAIGSLEKVLLDRKLNYNNRKIVLSALENKKFFDRVKNNYSEKHKDRLKYTIDNADFRDLQSNNFSITKNALNLDPEFITNIQHRYIEAMATRYSGRFGTNIQKIVEFLKLFPQSNRKSALLQLHNLNKNNYIQVLISKFPELKKFELMI